MPRWSCPDGCSSAEAALPAPIARVSPSIASTRCFLDQWPDSIAATALPPTRALTPDATKNLGLDKRLCNFVR
jgi:hypothetical protein